jgi:hypothetical protein
VQTVETGFGDNLSEWNAAYAGVEDGKLYLMFTGNLEDNFNKLELFLDTGDGGSGTLMTAGNDGSAVMDGLIFDAGFAPGYHLILRRGDGKFDLDFANLATGGFASYEKLFGDATEGRGFTGTPTNSTFAVNPGSIGAGFDNSNTGGVGGTAGNAANQEAALAVTTGLELCIDLADLGLPSDSMRAMLFQNNQQHDFASNQFLGGLPGGTGNLAAVSGVDLNSFEGDQFFTIPLPAQVISFVSIEPDVPGDETVITWTSVPGSVYLIESSPDLVTWTELEDSFPASAGATTAFSAETVFSVLRRAYFRVSRL